MKVMHFQKTGSSRPVRRLRAAFTLIELLVVIAIIAVLSAASIPALQSFGAVNMDAVRLRTEGVLGLARQYAQAHNTYVRVGFYAAADSATKRPSIVIQCIYSATGDLRNDSPEGLANPQLWPNAAKPIVLGGVGLDDTLRNRLPAAGSVTSLGLGFTAFSRNVPALGRTVPFENMIQFDPQGQATTTPLTPSRYIMVGLTNSQQKANPVVLLLSGFSGRIEVLRAENLQL